MRTKWISVSAICLAGLLGCALGVSHEYVATAELQLVRHVRGVEQKDQPDNLPKCLTWIQERSCEWSDEDFKRRVAAGISSDCGGNVGEYPANEVIAGMLIDVDREKGSLLVRAVAKSAADASNIANAYATSIVRHLESSQRESALQGVKQLNNNIERKIRHLEMLKRKIAAARTDGGNVQELEREYHAEQEIYNRMQDDAAKLKEGVASRIAGRTFEVVMRADPENAISRVSLFKRWWMIL